VIRKPRIRRADSHSRSHTSATMKTIEMWTEAHLTSFLVAGSSAIPQWRLLASVVHSALPVPWNASRWCARSLPDILRSRTIPFVRRSPSDLRRLGARGPGDCRCSHAGDWDTYIYGARSLHRSQTPLPSRLVPECVGPNSAPSTFADSLLRSTPAAQLQSYSAIPSHHKWHQSWTALPLGEPSISSSDSPLRVAK
jgi:hypothetical protein